MQTFTDQTHANSADPDRISLKDSLLELVWPTRCAGCERLGELLCQECQAAIKPINPTTACRHCGAPYGQLICTECYTTDGPEQFSFSQAVCALEFESISARMVVLYKNGNEHRLADIMAEKLYQAIPKHWLAWADCISWIPSDRKTLRRRGFDHMQLVAKKLAEHSHVPACPLLEKLPVQDQRALNRLQRRENLLGSIRALATQVPARILLVDDVLTTGATLDIAAQTLLAVGAQEIRVATFARVW